jgi:hypothetical protein
MLDRLNIRVTAIISLPFRMINKLVLENLKYRWVRTLLSALVVGVQVMSILTLIGLSRGHAATISLAGERNRSRYFSGAGHARYL